MDNIQKQLYFANKSILSLIRHFPYTLFNKSYIDIIEKHNGEILPMLTFCPLNASSFYYFKEELMDKYTDESGMFLKKGITQEFSYEKSNEK